MQVFLFFHENKRKERKIYCSAPSFFLNANIFPFCTHTNFTGLFSSFSATCFGCRETPTLKASFAFRCPRPSSQKPFAYFLPTAGMRQHDRSGRQPQQLFQQPPAQPPGLVNAVLFQHRRPGITGNQEPTPQDYSTLSDLEHPYRQSIIEFFSPSKAQLQTSQTRIGLLQRKPYGTELQGRDYKGMV